MQNTWRPPLRWVFAAATLLGIFSGLQSFRLTTLSPKYSFMLGEFGKLILLNIIYWYIPAALSPIIFRIAHRFRLDGSRKAQAFVVHAGAALTFSAVHFAGMMGARMLMWGMPKPASVPWLLFVQRQYLTQLDWTLMTYTTVVALSYALHYSKESQARAVKEAQLETRLVEARLRTLEAQLHPHFLFNTLHAISSLVHTNPDSADRMISRLSDLLRLTFDRSGSPGISLQEELEFLQKYLEIEQTRFQDRLSVHFDIDPETLDAEVPRLLLQPLVENAIKHGLTPQPGSGMVQIASRHRGDTLWIEVSDNGVGLSAGARARLRSGVGLSNTRDRLECLYGPAHRIEFSEDVKGLAVRLEIPFHRTHMPGHAAFQVA